MRDIFMLTTDCHYQAIELGTKHRVPDFYR
jgi:hypothetical protein